MKTSFVQYSVKIDMVLLMDVQSARERLEVQNPEGSCPQLILSLLERNFVQYQVL